MPFSMHNKNNSAKPVSAGSLVGRAFFICLAFLIIPLFIHSFFQYKKENELQNQEIQLQEQDVRATLRVIGGQMVLRIQDYILLDWDLLESQGAESTLGHLVSFETISIPDQTPHQFVLVDQEKDLLLVGKKTSTSTAKVVSHSLHDLLFLKDAPFPIEIDLNRDLSDAYVEKFPVSNTDLILVLGAKEPALTHLHKTNFVFQLLRFILIVVLVGGGLVILLLNKLARPLNVLRSTMSRVADGMVHSRYAKQRFGFEINDIGEYFNETVDALLIQQKQAEEEKIKKEKLEQKLQLAQDIQAGLLPKKIPSAEHLDIGAAYLPALEVGGDFYDILPLSSGKILIVLADISDKGISACLFSLGLRSSLRALAEANSDDLAGIIKTANDLFRLDAEETSQFATVWIGVLDGKNLSYISLGHPLALLKRCGVLEDLFTDYPALGIVEFDFLNVRTLELREGDELLLFSDGATDAHDIDSSRFGVDRLKQSFLRTNNHSASEISKVILEDIQSFSRGQDQYDDLTLLVIRLI